MECSKAQKIAYNFLFSDCNINECSLEQTLNHIDNCTEKLIIKLRNDIKEIVILNFEKYKLKPFIAMSYQQIADELQT